MVGTIGLNPVPVAATHDPLGRAMTEEQKNRLREQLAPPVEEATGKERVIDRREGAPRKKSSGPDTDGDDTVGPGSIIDSYA